MPRMYDGIQYYSTKALVVPSLLSAYAWGQEMMANASHYNSEQLVTATGALVLCTAFGVLGTIARRSDFGLEAKVLK